MQWADEGRHAMGMAGRLSLLNGCCYDCSVGSGATSARKKHPGPKGFMCLLSRFCEPKVDGSIPVASKVGSVADDSGLRDQGSMYRALVCHIKKSVPLLVRERTVHLELGIDVIDHSLLGFTLGAVFGMDSRV